MAPGLDGDSKALMIPMLRIRKIGIDTGSEQTAFLTRNSALSLMSSLRRRLSLSSEDKTWFASLAIIDRTDILQSDEIGLSDSLFSLVSLPEGTSVSVGPVEPPASIDALRKKLTNGPLTPSDIKSIVNDIAARRYSEPEIGAFLVAIADRLNVDETVALTRAMAEAGVRLKWSSPTVLDKHSIGGIPGNRTSLIVVPIIAALGHLIPKTSSRSITSPAGTADTMEVLARVDLSSSQMQAIVEEHKGCIVWGGRVSLSPADDILITVERTLQIVSPTHIVASILSKKIAAGSTHLILDLPVGESAKLRSRAEANRIQRLFRAVAAQIGIETRVNISDGSAPIGRGIGPILEVCDALAVLKNDPKSPKDLLEKSLRMAGQLLELSGSDLGRGYQIAKETLRSGKALKKLEEIIEAQGPSNLALTPGNQVHEVIAPKAGIVTAIDCGQISRLAKLAGAPSDKGAGVYLLKAVGDPVRENEPLYRIHSNFGTNLERAATESQQKPGFRVST